MKKRYMLLMVAVMLGLTATSQTVTLTFSGRDAHNQYVQLNQVTVTNLTRGWQETLVWPDTILTLQNSTGLEDMEAFPVTSLQLSQNSPNPFNGTTEVIVSVADAGHVALGIADINGQAVARTLQATFLQPGIHLFRITLATPGTYILTARQNGQSSSIKIMNNGKGNGEKIDYVGIAGTNEHSTLQIKSGTRATSDNLFSTGDQMNYVGYATLNGSVYESHNITQAQQGSESFQLQFDQVLPTPTDGQPCPSTPTLTDIDGNVYNTVQLGGQCWMKENLRTTRFSNGDPITHGTEHSTIEKYYYYPNDDEDIADVYGLLYNWAAVMNETSSSNSTPSGVQGVCPDGWHVPSNAEWAVLTAYVGGRSQYLCGGESSNIAKALANNSGWNSGNMECAVGVNQSANNATNFTGMPTGGFVSSGITNFGKYAMFWTCTNSVDGAEAYYLGYNTAVVGHPANGYAATYGMGIRCVRDEGNGGGGSATLNSCTVSSVNANETGSGGQITALKDYDNNSYRVVQIGSQCWMKDNLRTKHYADGNSISQGSNSMFALTTNISYYFYPDGNSSNANNYGLLYNWKAAIRNLSNASTANPSGVQGVCPNGWHLPSEAEYAQLTDYVQAQSEYACNPTYANYVATAFASNEGWQTSPIECAPGYNLSANNATGFSAMPAGQWAQDPSGINQYASYWGASGDSSTAYSWNLMMNHPYPVVSYDMSEWAYSVRCVRN